MLILFILFLQTSHNGDEFLARHQYQDALQSLSLQLGNYTAWLNGTASNFTMVSLYVVVVVYGFEKASDNVFFCIA